MCSASDAVFCVVQGVGGIVSANVRLTHKELQGNSRSMLSGLNASRYAYAATSLFTHTLV